MKEEVKIKVPDVRTLGLETSIAYAMDLEPMSRLLLIYLDTMANLKGYCFASNAYLGALIGKTDRTVRRCLEELIEKGYVMRVIERDKNKVVKKRLLFTRKDKYTTYLEEKYNVDIPKIPTDWYDEDWMDNDEQ